MSTARPPRSRQRGERGAGSRKWASSRITSGARRELRQASVRVSVTVRVVHASGSDAANSLASRDLPGPGLAGDRDEPYAALARDPRERAQLVVALHQDGAARHHGAIGEVAAVLVADLRQALDALARPVLRPVVLHGVDQLAHRLRRQRDAGDDDARDLVGLDLVVHAREGQRELVVRVRDRREVGVDAGHDLRRRVQVEVTLTLVGSHRA